MRRVLYKEQRRDESGKPMFERKDCTGERTPVIDVKEGMFHHWGTCKVEEQEWPVGIIELTDGSIKLIAADDIQFIEGWKR